MSHKYVGEHCVRMNRACNVPNSTCAQHTLRRSSHPGICVKNSLNTNS